MVDTVTAVSRCAGLNHIRLTVQDGNSVVRVIGFEMKDFQESHRIHDLVAQHPEECDLLVALRAAIKAAGAVTYAQARTAVLGKSFDLDAV